MNYWSITVHVISAVQREYSLSRIWRLVGTWWIGVTRWPSHSGPLVNSEPSNASVMDAESDNATKVAPPLCNKSRYCCVTWIIRRVVEGNGYLSWFGILSVLISLCILVCHVTVYCDQLCLLVYLVMLQNDFFSFFSYDLMMILFKHPIWLLIWILCLRDKCKFLVWAFEEKLLSTFYFASRQSASWKEVSLKIGTVPKKEPTSCVEWKGKRSMDVNLLFSKL